MLYLPPVLVIYGCESVAEYPQNDTAADPANIKMIKSGILAWDRADSQEKVGGEKGTQKYIKVGLNIFE